MAPSVLSCGLTDRDCPHNRSGSDPTAYPGRYEGSEGQGRLRGKQPNLKPNQPSTCSSYTTQGATPKVSLPNSSASGNPPSCGTHASRPVSGHPGRVVGISHAAAQRASTGGAGGCLTFHRDTEDTTAHG